MKKGSGVFFDLFQVNPCFYLDHYEHLEIQDFILPENIDKNSKKIVKGYHKLLDSFKGTLSMHGPFKELMISSMDRQVQKLALKRLSQALQLGSEIGCSTMVVHSCFNPLMNYPTYPGEWVENAKWFWEDFLPVCERYNVLIALENIWDHTPKPILSVLKSFDSPLLRACLDTGHTHIFSRLPIKEWIEVMGDYLAHFHIHDNFGLADDHLPPGSGSIDFSWLESFKGNVDIPFVNEAFGSIKEERVFLEFMNNFQS